MVTPAVRVKKVVKHKRIFPRHHSDRYKRLARSSWRKPHGIDSKVRRKMKGANLMPSVGFGTDKRTKNVHPNGFKKFLVTNEKELECLLMHNRSYCAELAHNLSGNTRKKLVARAKELNVRVTNGNARLRAEENE